MYFYIKRFLDIVVSLVGLVVLMPLFILLSMWLKFESAGPVFFKQKRYGRNKTHFDCLKFRTMYEDAPPNCPTAALKDPHQYITRSGRLLRRLGLDELPQLINILKGDMSLIGPRPVVLAEKNLIDERDKYGANAMTPGIGGWAQSNGRDELDFRTKARLDGEYAQNFGIRMDLSCVWRTAVAIFTSKGFREGHLGDTSYKRRVQRDTKRITLHERVARRIQKDVGKITGAKSKGKRVVHRQKLGQ